MISSFIDGGHATPDVARGRATPPAGRSALRAPLRRCAGALLALALAVAVGCSGKKQDEAAAPAPVENNKPELKNGLTAEQANQVLAKIGDTSITLGDFADRLGNQSPYLRARYGSPERRREFLDNMVR